MSIFDDLEEAYFYDSKTTSKESLADISADEEEREKIEFAISQSRQEIPLRVDYSNFSNHVFFGSAYASVVFALSRIVNDYPWDGELKEKNRWRSNNNGFENYFFDTIYPKQHGHAFFVSGTTPAWIEIKDHEKRMVPNTSSVTIECAIKSHENFGALDDQKRYIFSSVDSAESEKILVYFSSSKNIVFSLLSGGVEESLSASFEPYLSSSHYVSMVYDRESSKQICYLDGDRIASRSLASTVGALKLGLSPVLGYYTASATSGGQFSGSIDDFRYWVSARKPELIKRNFYRTIHSNLSGGLRAYYKFNEAEQVGSNVIDYSGYGIDGVFTGSFSYGSNIKSGTLGSWFKDEGEPIYDTTNVLVSATLEDWRFSGTIYDRQNKNIIYNLVPSFFIDSEDHEETQRFLLLLARHYDRLKLYIDHMANVYNLEHGDYNNTPDELLDFVSRNYGLDVGSVYENVNALNYFFGEDVLSSGSLGSSLQTIKDQLRRNLVNSLSYIVKTKSTREAVESSLRSLGVDENVVEFNEYSIFSGGLTNTYKPMTVERRVARMSGANIYASSSVYSTGSNTYQLRAMFNTSSSDLTSSLYTVSSGSYPVFYLQVERQNATSSYGVAKLYYDGAAGSPIVSDSLSMFDNNWINFHAYKATGTTGELFGLHVGKLNYNSIDYHFSASADANGGFNTPENEFSEIFSASLGSSGSYYFDGYMQEFRTWNKILTSSVVDEHFKDFESLALEDFNSDIKSSLISHLKLNDFTGSTTGVGPLNDYAIDYTGSANPSYSNFSSSFAFNFPGKYVDKLQQTYSYDIGINNDKIRVRDVSTLDKKNLIKDVPFVSIDISPTISLNKEIVRWFGNIEKFNNIIGYPYLKYRDEIGELNEYRYNFFNNIVKSKVKFDVYLNLLKWFDNNFTYFISKLVPLDLASSLSNFVVEPHLFEYNKIKHEYPFRKRFAPQSLEASASVRSAFSLALVGKDLAFGDIGRFGAAASASAVISQDIKIAYTGAISSSVGINSQNYFERKVLTDYMRDMTSGVMAPRAHGNGFYSMVVESPDYLQHTLGIDNNYDFTASLGYEGDTIDHFGVFLSVSVEPANLYYTGSISGYNDKRWMLFDEWVNSGRRRGGKNYDFGLKYGGGFGQLYSVSNKSTVGFRLDAYNSYTNYGDYYSYGIGAKAQDIDEDIRYVTITEEDENSKTVVCWPRSDFYDQVVSTKPAGGALTGSYQKGPASHFGDPIEVEDYKYLEITVEGENSPYGTNSPQHDYINFYFSFQFFDDLPFGANFETALSSSMVGDRYITKHVENEVLLKPTPRDKEYTLSFFREIPPKKYMKVYTSVIYDSSANPNIIRCKFKAKLLREPSASQEKLLIFRKET